MDWMAVAVDLGGTAVMFLAAGALTKHFVSYRLARELEAFKAELITVTETRREAARLLVAKLAQLYGRATNAIYANEYDPRAADPEDALEELDELHHDLASLLSTAEAEELRAMVDAVPTARSQEEARALQARFRTFAHARLRPLE